MYPFQQCYCPIYPERFVEVLSSSVKLKPTGGCVPIDGFYGENSFEIDEVFGDYVDYYVIVEKRDPVQSASFEIHHESEGFTAHVQVDYDNTVRVIHGDDHNIDNSDTNIVTFTWFFGEYGYDITRAENISKVCFEKK